MDALKKLQSDLQDAKDAVDALVGGNLNESEHTIAVNRLRNLLPRYEDHLAIGEGVRAILDQLDSADNDLR